MNDGVCVYTRTRDGKVQTVTRRLNAHGQSRTPLYRRWKAMLDRCHRPAAHNYRFYGGRGVVVCDAWRADFMAFKAWAEGAGYAPHLELDRENPDGPYSPENCRWKTKRENIAAMREGLPLALDARLTAYAAAHGLSRQQVIEDALGAFLPSTGRR